MTKEFVRLLGELSNIRNSGLNDLHIRMSKQTACDITHMQPSVFDKDTLVGTDVCYDEKIPRGDYVFVHNSSLAVLSECFNPIEIKVYGSCVVSYVCGCLKMGH